MKRELYLRIPCSHEGCKEVGIYTFGTQKEYAQGRKRITTRTCTRHSKPNEVLSEQNKKTEAILFPEGTILKITGEIILPGTNN